MCVRGGHDEGTYDGITGHDNEGEDSSFVQSAEGSHDRSLESLPEPSIGEPSANSRDDLRESFGDDKSAAEQSGDEGPLADSSHDAW